MGVVMWRILAGVTLLVACSNATAPETEMQPVLVIDGYVPPNVFKYYVEPSGICDQPPGPGLNDRVNLCFQKFAMALGMSGVAVGLCAAKAAVAVNAAGVAMRWGACMVGTGGALDAWGKWLDATNADGWYDWSEAEIKHRMTEAAFARMYIRDQEKRKEQ